MNDFLLDKDFLKRISLERNREVFAKIISLNLDEMPVEEITGVVTGGSISIDGSSANRRTCSITLISRELNLHEYYWGLRTKFKIFIGLKNTINSNYEDIVWFPFGIFLITSFSTSQSVNTYTISIQGKDKMSLLNGELGGTINALSWDFGKETIIEENGTMTIKDLELKEIIRNAVHEYAKEPYHNIIIKDLDKIGLQLMEYRGLKPLYLLKKDDSQIEGEDQLILGENAKNIICQRLGTSDNTAYSLDTIPEKYLDKRVSLSTSDGNQVHKFNILHSDYKGVYTIIKCLPGEAIGYRKTNLTYAGDLIAKAGDSVTSSVLDKIVSMLGDYEYFYDIEGHFIFQQKPIYLNTSWNNIIKNEDEEYAENSAYISDITYSFMGGKNVISFENKPNFNDIKNDFSIWGEKKTSSGEGLSLHMRYAIDKKPKFYKSYDGTTIYATSLNFVNKFREKRKLVDWREIIYQMAKDYMAHNREADFTVKIANNNSPYSYYYNGITGYEQYYTDIYSFWRQLYNPEQVPDSYELTHCSKSEYEANPSKYFYYKNQKGSNYNPTQKYYEYINGNYELIQNVENNNGMIEKDYYILTNENIQTYSRVSSTKNTELKLLPFSAYKGLTIYYSSSDLQETEDNSTLFEKLAEYEKQTSTRSKVREWDEKIASFFSSNHNINQFNYQLELMEIFNLNSELIFAKNNYEERVLEEINAFYFNLNREEGKDNYGTNKSRDYSVSYKDYCIMNDKGEYVEIDTLPHEFYYKKFNSGYDVTRKYYTKKESDFDPQTYWNYNVLNNPEKLNFWFDFLDTEGDLSKYSVRRIGDRPKVENSSDVKAIYYKEIPLILFVNNEEDISGKEYNGYTPIQISSNLENSFVLSSQGKSAQDQLDIMLKNNTYCKEEIQINSIPVYHLQPNTRIFVYNENSKINDEYIINRINYNLSYNGNMTITAIRAMNNLF